MAKQDFTELEQLTLQEQEACTIYQSDASFFHACSQAWSATFSSWAKFGRFISRASALAESLDSSIQKFQVAREIKVYSGHGHGFSVLGCLNGAPEKFVGLKYSYLGFTSTSLDIKAAENFLRTRAKTGSKPVLLEIQLSPGYRALHFQNHEGEVLLPRGAEFDVTGAELITIDDVDRPVLKLNLTLPAR